MRLTDYLKEDDASAVTSGDIAGSRPSLFSKPIRRKIKKKYKINENTKPSEFSSVDVTSKLASAEKTNKLKQDSVVYGIEDAEGNITKVYVSKDQDRDFKEALQKLLVDDKDVDVNEILFDLRNTFDILYVEWPKLPEDEEVDNVLAKDKKKGDEEGDEGQPEEGGPEDMGAEDQLPVAPEPVGGADDQSILLKVIDMMKADADAKAAEAKAKAAEAEAEQAKLTIQLTNTKVKNEEDMLRAEEHFKKQAEDKKESERLAKLAKYRNEVSNTPTYEDVMNFNDIMNEDLTANANNLQLKVAALATAKAKAIKLYDDQIGRLQKQLAQMNKQAAARGTAAPTAAQTTNQQPQQTNAQ